MTSTEESAPPSAPLSRSRQIVTEAALTPAGNVDGGSLASIAATAAEGHASTVAVAEVQRVGLEGAVVLAVIRALGFYNRHAVSEVTGLSIRQVRLHWFRLHNFGYDLPDERP